MHALFSLQYLDNLEYYTESETIFLDNSVWKLEIVIVLEC